MNIKPPQEFHSPPTLVLRFRKLSEVLSQTYFSSLAWWRGFRSPTLSKLEDFRRLLESLQHTPLPGQWIWQWTSGLGGDGTPSKDGKAFKTIKTTKNQIVLDLEHRRRVDLEHRRQNAAWLLLLKQSSLVLIGIQRMLCLDPHILYLSPTRLS